MRHAWVGFAALTAVLHVLFFVVESILFPGNTAIQERFQATTPEKVEAMRVLFLNQGFYNLFLALGIFAGLFLALRSPHEATRVAGRAAVTFGCVVLVGAGIVLLASTGKVAGALIQAVPPALALGFGRAAHGDTPPAADG